MLIRRIGDTLEYSDRICRPRPQRGIDECERDGQRCAFEPLRSLELREMRIGVSQPERDPRHGVDTIVRSRAKLEHVVRQYAPGESVHRVRRPSLDTATREPALEEQHGRVDHIACLDFMYCSHQSPLALLTSRITVA
jgi:hypothetical protein